MAKFDTKERIKRIQSYLGVPADGFIGPATLTALENRLFDKQKQEVAVEGLSLTVSRKGLCPDVNRRSLQRDLKGMLDKDLIKEIGAGPTDPTRHYALLEL